MTGEVATTTGLTKWQPDLGPLPPGWMIVNVEVHLDRLEWGSRQDSMTGLVTLRYAPYSPRTYHEVRLRLAEYTPPITEWFRPFLEALTRVPSPAYVDIDCEGRHYP